MTNRIKYQEIKHTHNNENLAVRNAEAAPMPDQSENPPS